MSPNVPLTSGGVGAWVLFLGANANDEPNKGGESVAWPGRGDGRECCWVSQAAVEAENGADKRLACPAWAVGEGFER